jgi:hypothetical protein
MFNEKNSTPLGEGYFNPAGSVIDKNLAGQLRGYRARVASNYRALLSDEINTVLSRGIHWTSPKVDGELWFLVYTDGTPRLLSPQGKIISGKIPVLEEASKINLVDGTVVAGELFAAVKSGRPRVGDLKAALGGERAAEVKRLGFAAFDIIEGGTELVQLPIDNYGDKIKLLEQVFAGCNRLKAIQTHALEKPSEVTSLFNDIVDTGKAEGLVARNENGMIYKIKPSITIDMVVIGYTEKSADNTRIRSLLLALISNNNQYQIVGSCGNLGTDENRHSLLEQLAPFCIESNFNYASSTGEVFRFVKPQIVVEIQVTDLQTENSAGDMIQRMVLDFSNNQWSAVAPMPSASLIHPVFIRQREDKSVNKIDVRLSQIQERTYLECVDQKAEVLALPKSELISRKVWTKITKGKTAVQKLLIWKTNKNSVNSDYPNFVINWTDYSSGRKEPLKREVRLSSNQQDAAKIGNDMVEKKIKKGWGLVESLTES